VFVGVAVLVGVKLKVGVLLGVAVLVGLWVFVGETSGGVEDEVGVIVGLLDGVCV
jgi:hypothetical protein